MTPSSLFLPFLAAINMMLASLLKIVSSLPLPVLRLSALGVASILNCMPNAGLRWIVRVNLMLTYPSLDENTRRELEIKCVRSQCLTAVESLKVWGMPPDYSIRQIHHVFGHQLLTEALNNGKGLIVVAPHHSTWEVMNAWVNQYGSPTIMYKPVKNPVVDRFIRRAREAVNSTLVPTSEKGVAAIYKRLKQGGFTVILPDHVPETNGGTYAPFFNIATESATLVSRLAQKSGCTVLGVSCIRLARGNGFDIYIDEIHPDVYASDIQTSTAAVNRLIEKIIMRDTAQYMWGYRRFKSTPGFNGVYRWNEEKIMEERKKYDFTQHVMTIQR